MTEYFQLGTNLGLIYGDAGRRESRWAARPALDSNIWRYMSAFTEKRFSAILDEAMLAVEPSASLIWKPQNADVFTVTMEYDWIDIFFRRKCYVKK
ncbi:unnamed protein product [Arctia plantaginis]|uniref:Uncharacterized protein n=1 Tax=Arctia plantaginis TaxID=874455 RepID=A0A8S0ZQ39_ARCPL|nr:unnamed protein product [Arctia plantaginis]